MIPKVNFLVDKFNEILTKNPVEYAEPGNPEVVFPLYTTDWVRIFVVRQIDDDAIKTIDVEVSIPSSDSAGNTLYDLIETTSAETKAVLANLIKHIQYILNLGNLGFSIDFIENGCLLLASMNFDELPDSKVFELLRPPLATSEE